MIPLTTTEMMLWAVVLATFGFIFLALARRQEAKEMRETREDVYSRAQEEANLTLKHETRMRETRLERLESRFAYKFSSSVNPRTYRIPFGSNDRVLAELASRKARYTI